MTEEELAAAATTLQNQQALFVQALAAALEGRWVGDASCEGYLYAISPDLQGMLTADPPVVAS
jgi:hypothetical protein